MVLNKNITMYDYILEEKNILLAIIENRTKISKQCVDYFADKKIKEIIISGSGTSYHSALAIRPFLERILNIRVRAEYPMMFIDLQTIYYPDSTIFIGISQSGQSQSTTKALEKAKQFGAFTIGISENESALIFDYSDINILMDCGTELSVAKTKGYIAMMGTLSVLGIEMAKSKNIIQDTQYDDILNRLYKTAYNFDKIISISTKWVNSIRNELIQSKRLILLGYKNNYANVLEGALKMLETMRYGIYGYEIEEFYHGIYNSIDRDTYIIYLGSEGEYKEKVKLLKTVLSNITNHQFVITNHISGYEPTFKDCIIPFIDDPDFSVFEYIIPIQIIASTIPYDLGIDPFYASDPQFHSKVGSKIINPTYNQE